MMQVSARLRINVGCGRTPVPGWLNVDNSLTVYIATRPLVCAVAWFLGFLGDDQRAFIKVVREERIVWANGLQLPVPSECAEVVYASHMLEHLDRQEAKVFLREAYRALIPGGILRIGVPDLYKYVEDYLRSGDADQFLEVTRLAQSRAKGVLARLRYLMIGDRHHLWMYDGQSLQGVIRKAGFREVLIVEPGHTRIADPGRLNLLERADESVFAEALK